MLIVSSDEHTSPLSGLFHQAKVLQPNCVTVYIAPPLSPDIVSAEKHMPPSDFFLRHPIGTEDLYRMLEQALDKQRLMEELGALRQQVENSQTVVPPVDRGELSLTRLGHMLRDFTKAFSTNFNLHSSLNLFLDAIAEFLRPARLSILVGQPTTRVFEIRACRGLTPKIAEQIRLHADGGLPQWLMTEGRILNRSEVERQLHSLSYMEIHRDMQALKATVSIPLMASGILVGILNLGERITGAPYTQDELEILFSLASHVAVGIQDIMLHHEVQSQKTFTEKILRYMSSGVITIGPDEKISLCNHRAAESLGKSWSDLLHKDLRSLPSPLGDMLYETLHDGVTYHNHEVTLSAGKLPLQVNTYQVFGDQGQVSGGVMVFDDLTFQKLYSEERRRADQFDFLNKVVGRMAHEIKNPLVSIQTFVELLGENYDDPELRNRFCEVVGHDICAVNGITDKLVSFASKIPYRFTVNDANRILRDLVESMTSRSLAEMTTQRVRDGGTSLDTTTSCWIELLATEKIPPVRIDAEQFHKALTYLATFLHQDMTESGKVLVSSKLGRLSDKQESVWISLTGEGCRLSPQEIQQLLDPFCMEQSTLVDVGPCVSQKIIEEHGGRLEVRQEKSGDTTFLITLPVFQEWPRPADNETSPTSL